MMPLMPMSTSTPSVTPSTAMPLRSLRSQSWRSAMKTTTRRTAALSGSTLCAGWLASGIGFELVGRRGP